jgi:hypothetical protein
MDKQEILEAFKKAEIDWSKPTNQSVEFKTYSGLCLYFFSQQDIALEFVIEFLQPLWIIFRTNNTDYHFNTRQERLEAIRNVIKDLENE